MKAHTIVHLDIAPLSVAELLRCDHPDGRVSFRVVAAGETQVWLTGTADDFMWLAHDVGRMADRISLEPTQLRSSDQDVVS